MITPTESTSATDPYIEVTGVAIYDEEEIHPNCTVQILRNSVTGDISIGWWDNEDEPTTL